ncbi:MAG: sulfotransferase [Planctomycetes bacterium]|nr:sulfotransferase [Planctomycetota bacterium]
MLNSHPQLAVANDTHFIPRALEIVDPRLIDAILEEGDIPLTEDLVHSACRYHRFGRLGLSDDCARQAASRSNTYRQFVCELYAALASKHDKPLAGEKTPDYVRWLPLLHTLFPWSRSIHIVRDGRDTALSLIDWGNETRGPGRFDLWREQPLVVAALWWKWQVQHGLTAATRLESSRHLLVHYERLVESPEVELRRVAVFLKIPFASEMLRFHEGRRHDQAGLSAKQAWLPPTPGLRDWRRQMNRADWQLFETLVGDTLAQLGYPTDGDPPSTALVRLADEYRDRWHSALARRHSRDRFVTAEIQARNLPPGNC